MLQSDRFQTDCGEFNSGFKISDRPATAAPDRWRNRIQLATAQLPQSWNRFRSALSIKDPRGLLERVVLVLLLYAAAVLGREALHLVMPGSVRYLTFFPALMAAGFLCGLFPSIALLMAFAITGFFWIEPAEPTVPVVVHLALTLTFVLAGGAVIIPAVYAVSAHRLLKWHDERVALINDELRHRLKNLFAVTSSICVQSLKSGRPQEEISRNMIGRIQAVASAQDFLSVTSKEGSNLCDLVQAIVVPLCPDPSRIEMRGESAMIPSDVTTSFALVLHELATNAVKYGAWRSDCGGRVVLAWYMEGDQFWFSWREHGVRVSAPSRQGFGSKLIQKSLRGAQVNHLLGPQGAECTINIKIATATAVDRQERPSGAVGPAETPLD